MATGTAHLVSSRARVCAPVLSSVLALSIALAGGVSRAQSPVGPAAAGSAKAPAGPVTEERKKEAGDRFKRGVKLQEEGNTEAAIIEFERAYELAPNYRVLYNIGVVYRDKGDKANSLRAFERYLAEGGAEIDAKRKKEVEDNIARLRDVVAFVTIKSNVAGAEVSVDDFPVGKTPLDKPIYLNVGRRKIEVNKEGYKGESRVVSLAGSDKPTYEFNLKELKGDAPPPPTTAAPPPPPPSSSASTAVALPPPSPPEDTGSGQRTLGYALGAVGIVGLGVGAGFGFSAKSKWDDAKADCPNNACKSQAAQDKASSARTAANISTVGFAVGGVALAGGLIFLLTAPSVPETRVGAVKMRVAPDVNRQGGGVWLNGSF